jgi:hypothetical protein
VKYSRRLKGLEEEEIVLSEPGPYELNRARERKRDRERKACFSMLDFALALIGPVERPQFDADPEPVPAWPVRMDEEFQHIQRPLQPRERKAWYDPNFGGRIVSAHGGLGNSVDAIHAMPPQPVEEFKPPKPRPNPWGLVVPPWASEEEKRVARSFGWLPPEEMPPEEEE